MRVLLDNCVPRRFARRLDGHSVSHASQLGMSALSNGALLKAAAEAGFDVLLTVDRNLASQQHVGELPLALIVVFARSNSEAGLLPHLPLILATLGQRLQRRVYPTGP